MKIETAGQAIFGETAFLTSSSNTYKACNDSRVTKEVHFRPESVVNFPPNTRQESEEKSSYIRLLLCVHVCG